MRNITVAISDIAYRRARVWAAQRDLSISYVVQFLLETLPQIPRSVLRGMPEPISMPRSEKASPIRQHSDAQVVPSTADTAKNEVSNCGL